VCNVSYIYIFYYRLLCKVGVTCSVTCVYVFSHFKVRRPPPPPWPAWSMLEQVGRIFSFQSFAQHWIGGEGGIYAINVSIIFAPHCRCAWRRCYCQLMDAYVWKHSLYPGGCSWDSVWGSGISGYFHMEWWNFGEISLWWSGPEWTGLRDSELNPSNSNP
jgi:hypothetical protein